MPRWLTALATALGAAAWLFAGPLLAGRVLYFRDVSVTYYPDLVFVARSLAGGVWPLWHPGADAGAPFLCAYPVHLLLAWSMGARGALAVSPPLHVLVAALGARYLARRLGASPAAALVSGLVFALSGAMLGAVLYPVFLAAAWAPLAVGLVHSLAADAGRPWPRAVALAAVLATQVSTLGIEALPQTALVALVLLPSLPSARASRALGAALALAALLAAPAVAGGSALLSDSARGRGFAAAAALAYSAPPAVLAEAALPRFLGDVHAFSDVGFWGQAFYPGGSPFFLSLYLGPIVLLLAARAGRREARLWALVLAGVLLALGSYGPLGALMGPALRLARAPVKLFLLATLALALLAGRGVDRAARERGGRGWLLPGALLVALAAVAAWAPAALAAAVGRVFGATSPALVTDVVARLWPLELAATGLAALGAGLGVAAGGRAAALAGALAVLDLLRVNGGLNPSAPADFYELREPVRGAVAAAESLGRYRWFSFGAAYARGLAWQPAVTRTRSDRWLFAVDRQALMPRTHVIDGLEGAFDVDRMGLAPEGSTIAVGEADTARYDALHRRLRLANVRWVLSFDPLPEPLVSPRAALLLPEVRDPLRLYEVRDPLPRAFFVARHEVVPRAEALARAAGDPAFDPRQTVLLEGEPGPLPGAGSVSPGEAPSVEYRLLGPHEVEVSATTPPGFVVVLDGAHPDWSAADDSGRPVPVLRADGRYRAIPTAGGSRRFTLSYRPPWRGPALAAFALGVGSAAGLLVVSHFTAARARRVLTSHTVTEV
ncbi:MAG: hypothetical protein U0599_04690 [Vicinamibacteria bacterium]